MTRDAPRARMQRLRHVASVTLRWLFFAASIAYLTWFARSALGDDAGFGSRLRGALAETLLSALLFAGTAAPCIAGWRALLTRLADRPLAFAATARVFCLTQVAKYLPGNVGHHLGRVAYARIHLHVPAVATAMSLLQESALVVAAALAIGAASAFASPALALPLPAPWGDARLSLAVMLVAGFAMLAIVNGARGTFVDGSAWRATLLRAAPAWPAVASAFPAYLTVYVLNGVAVAVIASALMPLTVDQGVMLTGAYALSWMVGFLLPGAPGGLGVRETAFVMLAGSGIPADIALGIAMLSRVANVLADALIFLAGAALSTGAKPSH